MAPGTPAAERPRFLMNPSPALPPYAPPPLPASIAGSTRRILWIVGLFRAVCGALLLGLALLALRLVNAANSRGRGDGASREPKRKRDTATVRCVNCGVYLPKAEAIEGPRGPVCGDPKCLPAGAGRNR